MVILLGAGVSETETKNLELAVCAVVTMKFQVLYKISLNLTVGGCSEWCQWRLNVINCSGKGTW